MPKRTNNYQKLVLYINQQLAAKSAIVTESAMVWDKESKQKREVDILIEETSGPYKLSIGIECSGRKRKLGTKDVEQLHQKHQHQNIAKTVIVSGKGFSKPAFEYARSNGIELLTFNSAMKMEWPKWFETFKNLSLKHNEFTCTGGKLTLLEPHDSNFKISSGAKVQSPQFGEQNIHDFIYLKFQHDEHRLFAKFGPGEVFWEFNPPLKIVDPNGIMASVCQMIISYTIKGVEIPLRYGELGNSPFAYGMATEGHPYKRMAITASPSDQATPDGNPAISVTIHVDTE